MKVILKYLWIIVCLLYFKGYAQYQQLIYNSGFEVLNAQPTAQGQVDNTHIQFWESQTHLDGGVYLHSPDLYTASFDPNSLGGIVAPSPTVPPPHSGTNMVGMQPYELIQQNYENGLMVAGRFYVCNMYIWLANNDPGWWNGVSLQFWLATAKTHYKSESNSSDLCTSDYIEYASGSTHKYLGSVPMNLSSYPNGQWHKVTFSFQAPSDISSYDWMGIELIKPNLQVQSVTNDGCEGGYLFIDDVTMDDACASYCASSLGAITITSNGGTLPTGMAATCTPWAFTVENAQLITLNVFDRWGNNIVNNKTAYDVNGLKDVGFSDYEFGWTGDRTSLPVDVYTYKLHMENCSDSYDHNGTITNVGDCASSNTDGDIQNDIQENCCPQNLYFENITFSDIEIEVASQNIYIGTSSTGVHGPVTIDANAAVVFNAGQGVIIQPGELTILPGATVSINDNFTCINYRLAAPQNPNPKQRFTFSNIDSISSSNKDSILSRAIRPNLSRSSNISINPNPTNGIINLVYNKDDYAIDAIYVFSSDGSIITSIIWDGSSNKLDLSSLSNGVYYLKILSAGQLLKAEKVVIVK